MNENNQTTSSSAIASMVLGIIGFLMTGLLCGIPAVICGHRSLSIQKKDPSIKGQGMAITGLITGYLAIAWSMFIIGLIVLRIVSSNSVEPFEYKLF